jgi:hypothetical protein
MVAMMLPVPAMQGRQSDVGRDGARSAAMKWRMLLF